MCIVLIRNIPDGTRTSSNLRDDDRHFFLYILLVALLVVPLHFLYLNDLLPAAARKIKNGKVLGSYRGMTTLRGETY